MFRAFRTPSGYRQTHSTRTLLVAGALAFGCVLGAGSTVRGDSSYDTLERLLPAQTVGVLSLPSVQRAQAILDAWYAEFQGDAPSGERETPDVLHEIAQLLGMNAAHIDTKRPLAAALSLAMAGAPPMPSILVPVRDEDAALAALEGAGTSRFAASHASGRGYVIMTSALHYVADVGTFELRAPRDPSDVRVALDLAKLYQTYGPTLEFLLASMMQQMQSDDADPSALEATTRAAEWAREVLSNAERFELTLSAGTRPLRLSSTLRSRPGSPPVVPVRDPERMLELTRVLDRDATLLAMVSADLRALYDWSMTAQRNELDKQLHGTSPEQSDALLSLVEYSSDLQRLLAGPNAYSLDFDERGVRVVHLMQLEQSRTFVRTFRETMASLQVLEPLGLFVQERPAARLEGLDVHAWNLTFKPDFVSVRPQDEPSLVRDLSEMHQRLFGGDAGIVRLAIVDDVAVLVLHPDEFQMRETLKRLKKKSGKAPKPIRALAERHGDTPWLAVSADLRQLVAGFVDAVINPEAVSDARAYRALLDGAPVPVTLSSSQRAGVLHCELTAEVQALAAFFESFTRLLPERHAPPASGG